MKRAMRQHPRPWESPTAIPAAAAIARARRQSNRSSTRKKHCCNCSSGHAHGNTDHRRHLVLLKVRYATPLVVAIHLAVAVLKPAAGLSVRFAFFSLGFGPSQTHCTEGCDAAGVQTAGPVQAGLRAPMNECVMESRRHHLQRRRGCLPRVRALRERSVPPRPTGRTRDLQSGCREHARNAAN